MGIKNLQPYSRVTVGVRESALLYSWAAVGEYTENVQPCSMAVIEDKVSLLYSMTGMCKEIKRTKTKKSGRNKYIHEVYYK